MLDIMMAAAKTSGEYGKIELIEVPLAADPTDDEVRIRIESVGLCGTDLSIYKWTETVAREYHPSFPLVPGHEFAGVVEKAGRNITHVKPGDVVAVNPHISCGKCEYCKAGREGICENRPILGCHANGGLTQYLTVRGKNVFRLPSNVPAYLGSLAEPLSVTVHALERVAGDQTARETALIIGAGTIGLLQYIACKAAGYRDIVILGLNVDRERLALARSMGAKTVNTEEENPAHALSSLFGEPYAEVVFEVAGTDSSINLAVELVKKAGKIALVGIASSATPIDTTKLVFAEKEVIGVRAYNLNTWPKTMDIMGKIVPELEKLVTHRLGLHEIQTAIDLLISRQCLKVIIEPNRTAS